MYRMRINPDNTPEEEEEEEEQGCGQIIISSRVEIIVA